MLQVLILLLLVACSFNVGCASPAVKPLSVGGIIFPTINRDEDCFVDERRQVAGTCKTLAECPSALQSWKYENIRPQTCYFIKFEHVVCCAKDDSTTLPNFDLYLPPATLPTPSPAPAPAPETYTAPTQVQVRRSDQACESFNVFRTAVVHGEPTAPKEFPYMVALGWRSNFDGSILYRCGGVLVSRSYVLTAAHCANLGGATPDAVRIGGVNLTDIAVKDINITRIVVHPAYDPSSTYNDIAVIQLEMETSDKPACIWNQYEPEKNNVTAIGYGHTRFAGAASDQLLKAKLYIVSNEECKQFFSPDPQQLRDGVINTQMCAGDPEHLRDTCQGDSGGPILMHSDETGYDYVVGITSFGQGCAGEPPSIYTRVSAYLDWIEDVIWPLST